MSEPPAVSVVVCCYNAATTVVQTLATLQAQSFANLEIIAIDDGSRDNTLAVLNDYAMGDQRMRVLTNSMNRGTAFTRQRGLQEARAPLVLFFGVARRRAGGLSLLLLPLSWVGAK